MAEKDRMVIDGAWESQKTRMQEQEIANKMVAPMRTLWWRLRSFLSSFLSVNDTFGAVSAHFWARMAVLQGSPHSRNLRNLAEILGNSTELNSKSYDHP